MEREIKHFSFPILDGHVPIFFCTKLLKMENVDLEYVSNYHVLKNIRFGSVVEASLTLG